MESAESAMEKGEAGLFESAASSPDKRSFSQQTLTSKTEQPTPGENSAVGKADSFFSWIWNSTKKRFQRSGYRIPVKVRRLNDCPRGYPNLAAFLDSDEGYMVYRRFGYLQSRLLLDKQEGLRLLEEKLDKMDKKLTKNDDQRLCTRDTFGPDAEAHKKLLVDIEERFCSYANLLTAAQQMVAFNRPAESDYNSIGRYMNNRQPLVHDEATWIHHKEDMITLRAGREHAWLDDVVEGFLRICHCRFIDFLFRSEETRKKTEIDPESPMPANPPAGENKYEIYYTPERVAKLAHGILTVLILTLLIVPIYILYHLVNAVGTQRAYTICIGTLLIFTLAFSAVLSLFTKAKRHEILAAAAAYCAVLVVFLGNIGPKVIS